MNQIVLPNPSIHQDLSLMDAIMKRRTTRRFSDEELNLQLISNILFVASGETFQETKTLKNRRTIPSARNSQCVSVYAVLKSGIYRYSSKKHSLSLMTEGDHRLHLSTQKMMSNAPFGVLFIADYSKLTMYTKSSMKRMVSVSNVEVGCMSQNIYLYATSMNLGTVLVGLVNKPYYKELLNLEDDQELLYSQIVGHKIKR